MAGKKFEPVLKAADYFEPLLRVRIVRAMKALKRAVSVEDIALAIRTRQTHVVPTATIQKALEPAAKVVRDAVRHGVKIGWDLLP